MNIALDFDNTASRDLDFWIEVIHAAQRRGHNVYLVTMRYLTETQGIPHKLLEAVDGAFFTGRKAKKDFMFARQISIDVWIDDQPFFILEDAAQ